QAIGGSDEADTQADADADTEPATEADARAGTDTDQPADDQEGAAIVDVRDGVLSLGTAADGPLLDAAGAGPSRSAERSAATRPGSIVRLGPAPAATLVQREVELARLRALAPAAALDLTDAATSPVSWDRWTPHRSAAGRAPARLGTLTYELADPTQASSRSSVPTVVVSGPAGAGKTALAAAHADAALADTDLVWWIDASSEAALLADVSELCDALGLERGPELDAPDALVEHLTRRTTSWLLVLDGAHDSTVVDLVRPESGVGRVVVTSDDATGMDADELALRPLDEAGAVELLSNRIGRAGDWARVARLSGGSPLTLSIMARHIAAADLDADAYLAALERAGSPSRAGLTPPAGPLETVVAAAFLALVGVDATAAAELTDLVSVSGAAPIDLVRSGAWPALRAVLDTTGAAFGLTEGPASALDVHTEVRRALERLAPTSPSVDAIDVIASVLDDAELSEGARLTHATRVALLDASDGTSLAQARVALDGAARAAAIGAAFDALALQERGLALAEATLGPDDELTVGARRALADRYVDVDRIDAALECQVKVLEDCERLLGPQHLQTVRASANLAANFAAVDDHALAVYYGEQAIAGLVVLHGPDHPDTVAMRDLLDESRAAVAGSGAAGSGAYATVSTYGDAYGSSAAGGPSSGTELGAHPQGYHGADALVVQNDWSTPPSPPPPPAGSDPAAAADAYSASGYDPTQYDPSPYDPSQYERGGYSEPPAGSAASGDALTDELSRELDEVVARHGDRAVEAMGVRHQLAEAYADAGRHDRARELFGAVLDDAMQLLGPTHPDTLTARANLANSYAESGELDQAIELQVEVCAEHETHLGTDHPHTLTARNNLA
ncbi:MAG: tetratricopeptide repeat protein, partial [Acidimicrobiia bacterium]|nr:tetratricopeptide repeat protein [Acidimicrobiia bacterium]